MKNIGKVGMDKVTGFKGIITGKCDYLYGCSQYLLTPKVSKEGGKQDGGWFDEGRIEILLSEEGIKPEEVKAKKNGCEFREHPGNF